MLTVPPPLAAKAVCALSAALAHVDYQSSLLLSLNERVVAFSLEHDAPEAAIASLRVVQQFDRIGSTLISFAVWLASFLLERA